MTQTQRKKDFPCIRCDKHVPKFGDALQCSLCDLWAHKACTGLDDNIYNYIVNQQKHQGGRVSWTCASCLAFASKFNAKIREFDKRFSDVEESVANQATDVDDIKKSVAAVETSLKALKDSVAKATISANATDKSKQATTSTTEVLKEMEERKARQSIVIIHGLSEADVTVKDKDERIRVDKEKISELLSEIEVDDDVDNLSFAKRLGARPKADSDAPRPLRVGFKTAVQQSSVLDAARKIDRKGGSEFAKVFVVPDITRLQRQEEDGLRKEADRLNAEDKSDPKNSEWKVIGQRGKRRLVQFKLKPATEGATAAEVPTPPPRLQNTSPKNPWVTPKGNGSPQQAQSPRGSPLLNRNVTARRSERHNKE